MQWLCGYMLALYGQWQSSCIVSVRANRVLNKHSARSVNKLIKTEIGSCLTECSTSTKLQSIRSGDEDTGHALDCPHDFTMYIDIIYILYLLYIIYYIYNIYLYIYKRWVPGGKLVKSQLSQLVLIFWLLSREFCECEQIYKMIKIWRQFFFVTWFHASVSFPNCNRCNRKWRITNKKCSW